nr:transglutaminase domain-containing protein [Propionibacterium sp.]
MTATRVEPRLPLRRLLLGSALAVTILGLLGTWTAIVADRTALLLAGGTAVAVLATGLGARALRLRESVATFARGIALLAILGWLGHQRGGIPRLPTLLVDGARHLEQSVAPVPAHPGATVLLCLIVGVLALLADTLAGALDRPVGALVPLLTLLLVPALAPRVHVPPVPGLVILAFGFALILLAGQERPVSGRPAPAGVVAAAVAAAGAATTLALVAALALAPLVRVPPSARGADGEPIQMTDVSLQLRREISQGVDRPALEYRTTGDAGVYLRLYSLPTFNADGWHLTNSTVQVGGLARPPGVPGDATRRRTDVTITGFRSEWLPAPYAPIATSAGDAWGYLPDSLAILALGVPNRQEATAGLTYTVDSLDVRPTAAEIAAAGAAPPPDAALTASVPSDISPELVRLGREITRNAPTAGAKAQAILAYLRSPGFTYSLDAQPGSGYDSLEDFLLRDRRGFCVQYAASMAILARVAGVPSRVAIGFTPGTRDGDGWVVTMHDMHAWPELYLAGHGWVAFEPTPGIGTGSDETTATPSPSPSPSPSAEPSAPETAAAPASPSVTPAAPDEATPGGPLPLLAALGLVGMLA